MNVGLWNLFDTGLGSLFFCLAPFILYQKPVIDHCPWPSSQFNKWHALNKLLSSPHLIVIGSSPLFTPLTPANHCRRKTCIFKICSANMMTSNGQISLWPLDWPSRHPAAQLPCLFPKHSRFILSSGRLSAPIHFKLGKTAISPSSNYPLSDKGCTGQPK
jgi:hypothetical protein